MGLLQRFWPRRSKFLPGYSDAKYTLLVVACIGELLQGGLVFGWNALALMLTARGTYSSRCNELSQQIIKNGRIEGCKAQEGGLALLWTLGIFALNIGPVPMGFVLDLAGPRYTSIVGIVLNMVGLIVIAFCSRHGPLWLGAVLIGLGGITFHLAQFHISGLFPRKRGFISALFVAGFTGCGIVFYVLDRIFEDLGGHRAAFRWVLISYAIVFCGGLIPFQLWLMPKDPFSVGEVYVYRGDSWRPQRMQRTAVEIRHMEATDVASPGKGGKGGPRGIELQASNHGASLMSANGSYGSMGNGALPTSSLTGGAVDSSDPAWLAAELDAPQGRASNFQEIDLNGDAGLSQDKPTANGTSHEEEPGSPTDPQHHPPLNTDVVWGPLVFEPRRFVELRKQSFWKQVKSAESFGMGLFYTLNVFFIQFYLGTARLQLVHKGDFNYTYTDLANILPMGGILSIGIIAWLLDKKGYGITLGTINALSVIISVLQAIPSLGLQAVTIVVWTMARFFLYASYFTIFGVLFGFKNFGKMVAVDNVVNGLFGLLQLPLQLIAIHRLDGDFTGINVAQIVILAPLFVFCFYMRKWETQDLVPIRPMEGEELPCNQVGERQKRNMIAGSPQRPHGPPPPPGAILGQRPA